MIYRFHDNDEPKIVRTLYDEKLFRINQVTFIVFANSDYSTIEYQSQKIPYTNTNSGGCNWFYIYTFGF